MDNNILNVEIEKEIQTSYIDYSMSVIVSRALPDVRDGLKPVHRRILYCMYKLKLFHNKNYKKSARIVGEVLGKFHPHGDKSVYDSIVRMVQNWILRYPLIDGQGNFGSIDNDPPAAMRYTEIKMLSISNEMISNIKYNTVDMIYNFDNSLKEPKILPNLIPNLLINGTTGIAVGVATNMPSHNIKESINSICSYINNKDICIDKLISIIKGPDFATGGIIFGYYGIQKSYYCGKGKIILRSKFNLIYGNKRYYIVITEIPYQIIKSTIIERALYLIRNNKLFELDNVIDKSDRNGIKIVFLLKKNCLNITKVLFNLFKYTSLESSYSINNVALVDKLPIRLNLKKIIKYFVKHKFSTLKRKIKYKLNILNKKIHIIEGILKISNKFKLIVNKIFKSISYFEIKKFLIKICLLSEIQSNYILNLPLSKLTNYELLNNIKSYNKYVEKSKKLKLILYNKLVCIRNMTNELYNIKNKYKDNRLTDIIFIDKKRSFTKKIYYNMLCEILLINNKIFIKQIKNYNYNNNCIKYCNILYIKFNNNIKNIILSSKCKDIYFFTNNGYCFKLNTNIIINSNIFLSEYYMKNIFNIYKNNNLVNILFVNFGDIDKYSIIFFTKFNVIKRENLYKYINMKYRLLYNIFNLKRNDSIVKIKIIYE